MFDSLVLGGGGEKGFLLLGGLTYFSTINEINFDDVKCFSGTSIGGCLCVLLSIGYTPIELQVHLNDLQYIDIEQKTIDYIKNITLDYGIFDIDLLIEKLKELIINKLGKIPTLLELFEITQKELYLTTLNITTYSIEYLNYKTHGDLLISDACIMTANIPIVFKKKIVNNNCYIDGGLANNIPVICVKDFKCPLIISCETNYSFAPKDSFISYLTSVIFFGMVSSSLSSNRYNYNFDNYKFFNISSPSKISIGPTVNIEENNHKFFFGYSFVKFLDSMKMDKIEGLE